ncbi:MAG TPA: PSD1 and planctomycete cytochrome C domain-containing protein [Fimbriiglobus sp.]|nr:PSD1 and planctomycete cytochrome C domain-containing protein [Fimbriiglobus sp.]
MPRLLLTTFALAFVSAAASAADPSAGAVEFFETKVRPVLAEHCYKCHGAKKQMAGLRLDTADGFRKGTDDGPIVVAGEPAKSPMVRAVRRVGERPMPPKHPLPADAVAVLTEWVKAGAPYPADRAGTMMHKPDAARKHWAFRPVLDPIPPATKTPAANPIDRFLLAKLEEHGLGFSPPAVRRTLIRRAYFDLIGLPPTYEEVEAFVHDPSPGAYERLIDRLLASPAYGERWGRHWLDLARYSDSKGYVFTEERKYPFAYTYRDYVIRAFNEDKPYDQFVVEQLAADKLPLGEDKSPLAALGFLTLGRRFSNNINDIIDDRIDVVTRGLMGLTVACARCHDHKYDPIPTADYYSLYGVFASTVEPKDLPLIGAVTHTKEYDEFVAELAEREKALADFREKRIAAKVAALGGLAGPGVAVVRRPERLLNRADRNESDRLKKKIDQFRANSPAAPPRAMAVADAPRPTEPVVFLRGNPNNRGPRVPRRMPAVVAGPNREPFTDGSGRLELARAIASPANPLTARVFVNRVWMHHFGRPLVNTPSDFGTRSDPPTHPLLLDWLAARFVEDGWSVKKLHKRMMLSAAYQQASDNRPELAQADPESRLLGRANRKRADFEAMRDGLLAVSGKLDRTLYGRSVDLFKRPYTTRRSVYAFIDRQNLPGTLRAFDFPSPDMHSPQRPVTTVPQQALFLMNSPFAAEQARGVVARRDVAWTPSAAERVKRIYRAVLSRDPSADEVKLAREFVVAAGKVKPAAGRLGPWELFAQVLLLSNEFAFVD